MNFLLFFFYSDERINNDQYASVKVNMDESWIFGNRRVLEFDG